MVFSQVEGEKKTLILHGTKTSNVLNTVLTEIYHLKKENCIKYSRKNENVRPFEAGGETSLEFFSQKTDCNLFVVSGSCCLSLFHAAPKIIVLHHASHAPWDWRLICFIIGFTIDMPDFLLDLEIWLLVC